MSELQRWTRLHLFPGDACQFCSVSSPRCPQTFLKPSGCDVQALVELFALVNKIPDMAKFLLGGKTSQVRQNLPSNEDL